MNNEEKTWPYQFLTVDRDSVSMNFTETNDGTRVDVKFSEHGKYELFILGSEELPDLLGANDQEMREVADLAHLLLKRLSKITHGIHNEMRPFIRAVMGAAIRFEYKRRWDRGLIPLRSEGRRA